MQNLQDAGFTVDLQLMDWASVMSRRFDPAIWEGFVTFHGFVPDPALITILSPGYPGWWDTPAKRAALETFNAAADDAARAKAWGALQDLLMHEAPHDPAWQVLRPAGASARRARRPRLAADAVLGRRQGVTMLRNSP